jgi:hypothetical protein
MISTAEIEKGRFFSKTENRSGSRVAIIGKDIADNLFENENALGETFQIGNYTFRVIGELEKQGKFLYWDDSASPTILYHQTIHTFEYRLHPSLKIPCSFQRIYLSRK